MSIIAFVDSYQKKIKKSAFEVVSYAKNIADQSGKGLKVVAFNVDDVSELEKYGATDIIKVNDAQLDAFSAKTYAEALLSVTEGSIYVLSHSNMGSSIGAFLSIKKQATLITNVLSIPSSMSPFTVKRKSFSGKGIMEVTAATDQIVVTVMPNSFGAQEAAGNWIYFRGLSNDFWKYHYRKFNCRNFWKSKSKGSRYCCFWRTWIKRS